MNIKLVGIRNPLKPELPYSVKEEAISDGIWRIYINPQRVDFMREVVTTDKYLYTEIGIGGHVFRIDCTLDSLEEHINNNDDILLLSDKSPLKTDSVI